eukprot:3941854-Rhodomonas_salina.2
MFNPGFFCQGVESQSPHFSQLNSVSYPPSPRALKPTLPSPSPLFPSSFSCFSCSASLFSSLYLAGLGLRQQTTKTRRIWRGCAAIGNSGAALSSQQPSWCLFSSFSRCRARAEIGWQLQKRDAGVGASSLLSLDTGCEQRLAGSLLKGLLQLAPSSAPLFPSRLLQKRDTGEGVCCCVLRGEVISAGKQRGGGEDDDEPLVKTRARAFKAQAQAAAPTAAPARALANAQGTDARARESVRAAVERGEQREDQCDCFFTEKSLGESQ